MPSASPSLGVRAVNSVALAGSTAGAAGTVERDSGIFIGHRCSFWKNCPAGEVRQGGNGASVRMIFGRESNDGLNLPRIRDGK